MALTIGPSRRMLRSPNYKWWAYTAIAIGMFLAVMDQTALNIALPRIAEHFSADLPTVQWVALGYALSTTVVLLPMGRLSDIVGRKRVYLLCSVIFIVAAALGGFSGTLSMVIAVKIVQGIGSGGIQANGLGMVLEVFPERERGKAAGLYMAVVGTGAVSGPVVGGLLVSGLGWRSVFFAAVPVGLLAFLAALMLLQGRRSSDGKDRRVTFDWVGAGMSSAALISFLLSMTSGHRLGWTSPAIVAGFVLAGFLVAVLLWWERRAADPMLEMAFFRRRVFSFGVSARFLVFLPQSAVTILIPFYLVQALGYSAGKAGLLMVSGPVCMALFGPISGQISDRLGTRWPTMMGAGLMAASMFLFARLTVDSSPALVIVGMALSGGGMGIFLTANSSAIMSTLAREKYGVASAFLNLTRTTASLAGIAAATLIVTLTMVSLGYEPTLAAVSEVGGAGVKAAFVTGLDKAFLTGAGVSVLALVAVWLRGETLPIASSQPLPEGRTPRQIVGGE